MTKMVVMANRGSYRPLVLLAMLTWLVAGASLWALDSGALRQILLNGVDEVGAPGIPGPVCVVAPDAVAVVCCESSGAQAAIVAAGESGAGRLLALGHNGYLGGNALGVADTGALLLNAVRWLGCSDTPAVAVLEADALAAFLEAEGLNVTRLTAQSLETVTPNVDIMMLDGHRISSRVQLERLRTFVQAGGGILIGATGWGWNQLNPGKAMNRQFLANVLLADAGLAFSGAMSKRTSEQGFDPAIVPDALVNASSALDALLGQRDGRAELSDAELKQASTIVSQAARAVSVEDTEFLPRIELLLSSRGAPIIPTREHPVRGTDGLDRLVVALTTDRLQRTPAVDVQAHPAGADFPGSVAADAQRVSETLSIDTAVWRWHSTGLYAAPGERVSIQVPAEAVGKGLVLRIGAHSDGIWRRADWWRYPEITRTFAVRDAVTMGACAFGGLVYVEVPGECSLGTIEVTVSGAVRAPLYVHGHTDLDAWRQTIRHRPAPWAEVGSSKVIITVPSEQVRDLDDPADLMTFWDGVLDACADLAVRDRVRRSPERYVADRQISAGYMHAGYPIMTFLDAAPRFVDVEHLRTKGDWGMFHEMGHNHQSRDWTFGGTGEVTVNLFSLYVLDTCCPDAPVHNAVKPENIRKRIHKHLVENGADFAKWKRDPFTALVMYIQIQQAFGWDAYKQVFAEYRDLPADRRPKTDDEKRDQWLMRLSRTVGHNLGDFFQAWGVPTSEEARAAIADLPVWMPEHFPPDA